MRRSSVTPSTDEADCIDVNAPCSEPPTRVKDVPGALPKERWDRLRAIAAAVGGSAGTTTLLLPPPPVLTLESGTGGGMDGIDPGPTAGG